MATITISIPDRIAVGRNAVHGWLDVDWSKVPQHMLDHIGSVHFPQWFSDSFNAGGKEATSEERLAAAQKKRDQLYAGILRTRGESAEPADPFEAECYRQAKRAMEEAFRAKGLMKDIPKGTKDRFMFAVNRVRASTGKPEIDEATYIAEVLATPAGERIRKVARSVLKERAEMSNMLDEVA